MAKLLPAALPTRRRTGCGPAGEDANPGGRRGCRIGKRRRPVSSTDQGRSREHAGRFVDTRGAAAVPGETGGTSPAGTPSDCCGSLGAAGPGGSFAARVGTSRRRTPPSRPSPSAASGAAARSVRGSPAVVASPSPRLAPPSPPAAAEEPPRPAEGPLVAVPTARLTPSLRRPGALRRRRAPSERVLPNIDQAGIGIPSE